MARSLDVEPAAPSVLMVANYRPDVGFAWWLMEGFWIDLAKLAAERGMRAILAYPEAGEIPPHIQAAPICTITHEFTGSGLSSVRDAVRLVRQYNIRLVYLTDRNYTGLWYAALRLAGVRVIVTHDHTPGDRPDAIGVRALLKSVWRRLPMINADVQFCVSPLIQQRAVRNARIPLARTAVVQNGIEPIVCDGNHDHIRREFSIPLDAVVCVTVSRANPYKRIDFVIAVAERVVRQRARSNIYFVFCGDGPDLARLRGLAHSADLGEHFIFAGRRSDVPALLCSADLAIHPSRGEAFSLAVIEYMSAGLTLLVPNIPSVCQAVSHDDSGVIFPDGDTDAAAESICQLADDLDRRRRIGARAALRVRTDFCKVLMHKQFRAQLQRLISRLLKTGALESD